MCGAGHHELQQIGEKHLAYGGRSENRSRRNVDVVLKIEKTRVIILCSLHSE